MRCDQSNTLLCIPCEKAQGEAHCNIFTPMRRSTRAANRCNSCDIGKLRCRQTYKCAPSGRNAQKLSTMLGVRSSAVFLACVLVLAARQAVHAATFSASTCPALANALSAAGANTSFVAYSAVDSLGEWVYNGLFTCVGAGAPAASCDTSCKYCAGGNTYGTVAQQYAALYNASLQTSGQYANCPQTCLRSTRPNTVRLAWCMAAAMRNSLMGM